MALVVQTAAYLASAPGDIPAVAAFAWTAIGKSIEDAARAAAVAPAAAAAVPAPAAGGAASAGGGGRRRQMLALGMPGGGASAVGRGRRMRMLHPRGGEDMANTEDYYEYDGVVGSEAGVERRRLMQEGPVEFEPPRPPPLSPPPSPPPQPPVRFNLTDPTYIASVLSTTLQLMGAARNGSSNSGGGSGGGNTTQSALPPLPPPAVQPNEDGVLNATLRDAATDSMAHMQLVIAGAVASANLTNVSVARAEGLGLGKPVCSPVRREPALSRRHTCQIRGMSESMSDALACARACLAATAFLRCGKCSATYCTYLALTASPRPHTTILPCMCRMHPCTPPTHYQHTTVPPYTDTATCRMPPAHRHTATTPPTHHRAAVH